MTSLTQFVVKKTKGAKTNQSGSSLETTDHVAPVVRSAIMRAVKSKGGRSTEAKLRAALVSHGIRGWRINADELPSKPDFVFEKELLAIFVDGCFWHGCPKCYRRPRSNRSYWDAKVTKNLERDRRQRRTLRKLGWTVIQIWEHDFKVSSSVALKRINRSLKNKNLLRLRHR
jgi:DNA mismatch endonuclease (patch repair protein)